MANPEINQDITPEKIGHDSTATFDNSPSNPTEYAGSESLASTASDDEDEDLGVDDDLEDGDFEDEDDVEDGITGADDPLEGDEERSGI